MSPECADCGANLARYDHRRGCAVTAGCGCGQPLCGYCMQHPHESTHLSRSFFTFNTATPQPRLYVPEPPADDPWAPTPAAATTA